MKKSSNSLTIIGTLLTFITTVVLFIGNLQNWVKDPNLLRIFSVVTFLLSVAGILWFFFKAKVAKRWKRTSLIILCVFSALFFVWVGTWFTCRDSECPPETLTTAHIREPKNGEAIDMFTPFMMEYDRLRPDSYLWVAIQVPNYGLVYLWDNAEFQNNQKNNGTISSNLQVGAPNSKGVVFNIIVLLVDKNVNFIFQQYINQCRETKQCNGTALPETGIRILDFRTVTRK